jgi:hypothetical protein
LLQSFKKGHVSASFAFCQGFCNKIHSVLRQNDHHPPHIQTTKQPAGPGAIQVERL